MSDKMIIEVWSDMMCPFCYIGKRKFEAALAQFPHQDKVEWVWRSFQLDPDLQTNAQLKIHQYLAMRKGISIEQALQLNQYVTQMAKTVGLTFALDKAVVANSFNAHRFVHFAKAYTRQNQAKEALFRAYFTEGRNIDNMDTLLQLGEQIGLDTAALKMALENGSFADAVNKDLNDARQLGINGVPFFLFNKKFALSGAQDSAVFLSVLHKAFTDWRESQSEYPLPSHQAPVCTPEGDCL
jgi:protein disulfide-isomerase